MNKLSVKQLLHWRLSQAEGEAPPAPRATRLLELAQPWWEVWPERFQSLLERVGRIQVAYGHAMTEPASGRSGYPVPAIVSRAAEEVETSVRVLYFAIREGRLRLRFELEPRAGWTRDCFEATFVAVNSARPLLSANATPSVANEYRLDAVLSQELAREWASLKVTDRMPFRLILRACADGGSISI